MASQTSIASSQPDARHLRLIAAAAQANEARVRDILAEDPTWSSHADRDALRQALQKVATRGHLALVRLLLERGADVQPARDAETPALFKAAEAGHAAVVRELLDHGADPDWRSSRTGQTALFAACQRGRDAVVRLLLDAGAAVDLRDREGRTPLLLLAAEKADHHQRPPRGGSDALLRMLIEKGADVEARDAIGRTPLLWAATTGNARLAAALLDGDLGRRADMGAANNRGRNALHLAAESNHEAVVRLLLERGADPRAASDGGWTALHNAAQNGHAGVVALLLQAAGGSSGGGGGGGGGASDVVNAELSNGMTPLHWAAFNGHEEVVRLLLARPEADIAVKDGFDRTPMLCAAERRHKAIVQLLSPARAADRLSPAARRACRSFEATVVDFGHFRDGKKQLVFKHSVFDLLYGWDGDKPRIPTLTKNIKYQPAFRWIHLPANNIAWVETLLAKSFVEGGHRDIEAFKALEKCFGQEHRGPMTHAHFMRTFCQRITSPPVAQGPDADEKTLVSLSEEPSVVTTSTKSGGGGGGDGGGGGGRQDASSTPTPKKTTTPAAKDGGTGGGDTPRSESKKKSKSDQIAERHGRRSKRTNGPPGNPPGSKENRSTAPRLPIHLSWELSRFQSGKLVLFMPFLHYETDERRRKMSRAIVQAKLGLPLSDQPSRDELLVHAYLTHVPPLHPRRTLDQFFYHGIDTSYRDVDQVVYRYCKRHHVEPKLFMVDQLWLWVLGRDLVVTCFPQRWEQPKQDPLNVLDGIIEETNAKTRPPVQSAYDLAMLVTGRCAGLFDRHRLDDQDYQFLDMFESSIGHVTNRESQLFDRFNRASRMSALWLQHHGRRDTSGGGGNSGDGSGALSDPVFPDALLDIGVETSLLAETKDIRDELNIIAVVLDSQTSILGEFEAHVTDELRGANAGGGSAGNDAGNNVTINNNSSNNNNNNNNTSGGGGGGRRGGGGGLMDPFIQEIRRRAREQRRLLEVHRKDVERMDRQAESIYTSLTHLLDLKQKHSNALEARFARDQAVIAARQGQTVLVFTIVTIVFVPMSFLASFFSINFDDWPGGGLTLALVAKYLFGIGLGISIPLIAMAFTVSDIADATRAVPTALSRLFGGLGRGRRRRRRRRRSGSYENDGGGPSSGHGENDDGDDGSSGDEKGTGARAADGRSLAVPPPPSSRPRASTADESAAAGGILPWRDRSWEHRDAAGRLTPADGVGGTSGRDRAGSSASRLSARVRGLGSAVGGATGMGWARSSLERWRARGSEDLERGKGEVGRAEVVERI